MDKLRRHFRSLFCVCLALGLLVVGGGPYAKATNIEDLQDEYDRLDQQIEANRDKLNDLASDMEDQQAYIDTLNDQIETTQQQAEVLQERIAMLNVDINSLTSKIEALNTKIQQTQSEADAQEEKIEETFELLKKRLRAMYMAGSGSQLEFLLNAGDFETFLTRTELLRSVTRHDTQLIDELSDELEVFKGLLQTMEADKASLQEQQQTLVARKADVQASAQQLTAKEDEMNANVKQANSYIQQLDHNSDLYRAQMKKLQADRDEVDAMIAAYIREHASSSGGTGGSSSGSSSSGGSSSSNKYLLWPLPGFHHITSYFGPRDLAGFTYHWGIDISGSGVYGHDIVAAESGTVLLAQTDKSWGKYILIDHGNGMLTRYAHCSRLLVSQGDRVTRGETIAKVGDTGNVTGPHLHFEVYEGENRYDPLNYLDPADY
ncbi:MAG TPA: peptidoglycan DD-metalloendopeptidase family protein [Candidatus Fimivicinus intestinavium]|nr:peptidoglycan DD-metalloendopeptidase family protein [Candidatus Fimivicinus intestinavium]